MEPISPSPVPPVDDEASRYAVRLMFIRVAMGVLAGGIGYVLWLILFLLLTPTDTWRTVMWGLAPVVTAIGYAVGGYMGEDVTQVRRSPWWVLLLWPLIGCGVGAALVFRRGPSALILGVFGAGTLSMVIREIVRPDGIELDGERDATEHALDDI